MKEKEGGLKFSSAKKLNKVRMDLRMGRIAHCDTMDTMQTTKFFAIKVNINIKKKTYMNPQSGPPLREINFN